MVHLPLEIILQVIDSLVDFGSAPPVALHPSDWRRVQLHQWLLVSKATNEVATRHLYGHGMYINSHRTLMLLVRTLSPPNTFDSDDGITSMPCSHLRHITSMYLAPFGSKLDDLPAAIWIFELFCLVSPFLKRLAFDIPFGSLTVHHDHLGVYRYLRNGLSRLEGLEELVYMKDIWDLAEGWAIDNPIHWWSRFRKLKRLAIPSPVWPDWSRPFPTIVQCALPELQQLVVNLRAPLNTEAIPGFHIDRFVKRDRSCFLKVVQLQNAFDIDLQNQQFLIEQGSNVELHSLPVPNSVIERVSTAREDRGSFALTAAVNGTLWTLQTLQHHC